ncbi:hypothetical protein B0T24DRAFT_699767, partial [Lasiosphaeria ovina]
CNPKPACLITPSTQYFATRNPKAQEQREVPAAIMDAVVAELVDTGQSIYEASSTAIGYSLYPSKFIGNIVMSHRPKIYGPVFKAVAKFWLRLRAQIFALLLDPLTRTENRVMSVVFVLAVVGLEDFLFTRLLGLFPAFWAWTLENILDPERLCDEALLYIYTSLLDKLGNFTVLFTIIQHLYLSVAIQSFFWYSYDMWHDSMTTFIWLDQLHDNGQVTDADYDYDFMILMMDFSHGNRLYRQAGRTLDRQLAGFGPLTRRGRILVTIYLLLLQWEGIHFPRQVAPRV